jgi:glutathione-regulated potassium-efflux system protein KefB
LDPQSFLYSAVLLLLATSVAVAIFRHFGLGSVLGLLVAGVFIGPHTPGPSVTEHVDDVRHFTELGVVLLLFLIGLEMQPQRLWSLRRSMLGLGSLQILVSGLAIAAYLHLFEPRWGMDILAGLTLALSSTAFVIQLLQERGEIASPHGQTAFAILLMQDLAIVPLLAIMPIIADVGRLSAEVPLWEQIVTVAVTVALVVLAGRFLVPRLLDLLARQNNREAFFLVSLAAVLASAWAMEHAGMSMALGAFLMGVALSGSRYNVQIQAGIEPHKGLLMSLFFVAVGMSIDVGALAADPLVFVRHLAVILAIKIAVLFGLCLLFREGRSVSIRVSFLLAQSGEFGFVLFGTAKALVLIDDGTFVLAVGVISLSMLVTPLLVRLADWLAARGGRQEAAERFAYPLAGAESQTRAVVAGYGRVGHTVGTILGTSGIPYIAFDTDPQRVEEFRNQGHPVYYGDIGDANLLTAAHLEKADLVVLTIDDRAKAMRATTLIRDLAPKAIIVARAPDLSASEALLRAGADKAFPEAVEASLRLAAVALESLGVATEDTALLLRGVRSTDYALVREGPKPRTEARPPDPEPDP